MSTTEAPDDLPRDADGFYQMWIFRYVRNGRFEEIHSPNDGTRDSYLRANRRARELATEIGGPVTWADGITSALTHSNHYHPSFNSNQMWIVTWPRGTFGPDSATPITVVECPNLEWHHPGGR